MTHRKLRLTHKEVKHSYFEKMFDITGSTYTFQKDKSVYGILEKFDLWPHQSLIAKYAEFEMTSPRR